jgi:hypothetical protein
MEAVRESLLGEDMSHITRITAVGLLVGALTSGVVQAVPAAPEARPSQREEVSGLLTLAMDRLASLIGLGHAPADRGTAGSHHGSAKGQEKEGVALDPNGNH